MGFKRPDEIVEAACTISRVKTEADPRKLLVLGFLAGAYIAFGCTVGICTGKCITAPELAGLSKLLFGGTFALGPVLIVIAGAEMFAANLALVDVVGDSMETVLSEGDAVLIDLSQTDIISGKAYVIRIGDELLVKYLQHLPGDLIQVFSENSSIYPPFTVNVKDLEAEIFIIGRVVASAHMW